MQKKIRRWKKFQTEQPIAAERIRALVLPACELLRNQKPAEQIAIFQSDQCADLRKLLSEHRDVLHIEKPIHAHVAWILAMCFCAVMRAETARA